MIDEKWLIEFDCIASIRNYDLIREIIIKQNSCYYDYAESFKKKNQQKQKFVLSEP